MFKSFNFRIAFIAFVAAGGSTGVSALVASAGLSGALGAHMTGEFRALDALLW